MDTISRLYSKAQDEMEWKLTGSGLPVCEEINTIHNQCSSTGHAVSEKTEDNVRAGQLTSKDGRVVALERVFEQVAAEVVEQGLLRSVRGVVFRAGGPVIAWTSASRSVHHSVRQCAQRIEGARRHCVSASETHQ